MISHSIIIIGNTPAAYTASIYAATANLKPLIIEPSIQQELKNLDLVIGYTGENYIKSCREHALKFNIKIINEDINENDIENLNNNSKEIFIKKLNLKTKILIVDRKWNKSFENVYFCGLGLGIEDAVQNACSGCKVFIDIKNKFE